MPPEEDIQAAVAATEPQTPTPTPAAEPPAPAPAEPPASTADLDPDAQALAAVRADIAAGKTDDTPTPAPDTPAPAATTPATPAPAPAKPSTMVPAAALLAERRRAQEAERQAAELRGQVSVLQTLVKPEPTGEPGAVPAAPAAPADRVAEIDAEIEALADKFDRGDITMLEFKRQERALVQEQQQVREARQQQQAIRQDTTLEQHSAQLVQQYPAVARMNADQVAALTEMAYAEAALEGKPIGVGVEATKDLRTRIARLAEAKFGQPGGTTTASPAAPQPLSRNAQANAQAIANAQAAPPDVSRMGTATTAVMPSDDEILAKLEHMSDDEANAYLNSMPGLRARIRGV